ncbi:bifunctional 3-(3-hydroxy-phenyl)propionate/3-hydroxycinnamic acid hydroxylase [Paenibacillus thalictri]|uniref:Bifunctional 3-(3-hydroxy-phenyl)propionate/3-hydroxycinnamic acid hydroxylase n=1 Tax=Paenibacillus thalictri TaxID=2527873 RepID=A0A4Q9DIY1_9BACL|nr:bifunctional 3-(3-hydroxy-phenyl)propionate/3-hydroxycinnamic acid hydroxylase [Paenibacillus thalictri]TBL73334.1 bifunctional 3-(3-hydroxy-phenyl)propionate/3-hydroxycinnamic acid hydroxylase [Paenibacillus thalictri]
MEGEIGGTAAKAEFDAAIIGGGPVGVTLANMLGFYGLKVAVFEKEPSVYHMPRASHMDAEVMRIYQSFGLSEALNRIVIGAKGYEFLNGDGKVLLKLDKPEGDSPQGWKYHYRFYQPNFEQVLRAGTERFEQVRMFLEHEVTGIEEKHGYVQLRVDNRTKHESIEVSASYVIGCDGGRSMVRRSLGIEMDDVGLRQQWLVVDVKLKREVALPPKGIQYCEPSRPITYVPMIGDYDRYRWEIMLLPGETKEEMERPEQVWGLLNRWLQPEDATLERASVYIFHSVIAKQWRKSRVFLAGDSAHQTPPFLGQGLCAGVRDAANLAWKLNMVVHGQAEESLLDTYQSERSPHVRQFIDMATELGKIITVLDPEEAAARDRKLLSGDTRTLVQPAPLLGSGIRLADGELAGTLFAQPRLGSGQLMDDAVGNRFAVIAEPDVIDNVSEETKAVWSRLDAVVLTDHGDELKSIFQMHDTAAFMIRPDRYVFGKAAGAAELERLTAELERKLHYVS